MRLRNNKKAIDELKQSSYFINQSEQFQGNWSKEIFKNNNDCYLEIGSGKGDFIINMAQRYPNINFIALEKYPILLSKILKKISNLNLQLNNLYLIEADANKLLNIFAPNEIKHIYLNFSDPWPKRRNYKRRLVHHNFLNIYKQILINSGYLQFKTDNDILFDFAQIEIKNLNWEIIEITNNLHNSKYKENNVMTEYEKRFVNLNKNINYLLLKNNK